MALVRWRSGRRELEMCLDVAVVRWKCVLVLLW